LHKCSLDILRHVNAAAAKLSSWRCGNKLIKASWHLKDTSKKKKLSKTQNSKPSIAWRRQEKLEKVKKFFLSSWFSQTSKNEEETGPFLKNETRKVN